MSNKTHETDYVYKCIDYLKIRSVFYYVLVEPETTLVTVLERSNNNNWAAHKYTQPDAMVKLPKLKIEFLLKQVYE